ncbi:MAG TPA: hypothetical protein VI895_13825 [Bdellovibrionota bacterium]|nr:hypothetical protein [Bdellovibrionota bacterium]
MLGCLFFAPRAIAGAWTHEPNKFYVEASISYFQASESFDRDGNRRGVGLLPDPQVPSSIFAGLIPSTYEQLDASLYAEYGLPADFEAVLFFPFFRFSQQDSSVGEFDTTGIGDATVGMKYKWFERPWLVSAVMAEVGIPVGDEEAMGHVAGQNSQPIPLGDGEWDYAIRFFASRSFHPVPAYVSADFGYRFRTSSGVVDFGDDLPWSLDGGYTFEFGEGWFSGITPNLAFRGVIATKNTSTATLLNLSVSGNAPNQEFVDIQPGLFVHVFKGLGWNNSFSYTLAGENTGAGWTVRSGLTYEN